MQVGQSVMRRATLGLIILAVVFLVGFGGVRVFLLQRPTQMEPRITGTLPLQDPVLPTEIPRNSGRIVPPPSREQLDLPLPPELAGLDMTRVEAKLRVPISRWHRDRVEAIRAESLAEMVANLANMDDNHLAMTTRGDRGYSWGDLVGELTRVVHLFRVRRLLTEGRRRPREVAGLLRPAYEEALAGWPKALAQRLALFREAIQKGGHPRLGSEPTEFDKYLAQAVVATYVLAELNDVGSLPVLVKGYKQQERFEELDSGGLLPIPVPRAMTLYAIHRLVSAHGKTGLSPSARRSRKTYVAWAQEHLPPPRMRTVSAWNADHDESDAYRRIVDPSGEVLADQPTMRIAIYPTKFTDGADMHPAGSHKLTEKAEHWAALLLPFAEAIMASAAFEGSVLHR